MLFPGRAIISIDSSHLATSLNHMSSGVDSGDAGSARATPEFWGSEKKPDFWLLEFSYYSKHLWIWKAMYGAEE